MRAQAERANIMIARTGFKARDVNNQMSFATHRIRRQDEIISKCAGHVFLSESNESTIISYCTPALPKADPRSALRFYKNRNRNLGEVSLPSAGTKIHTPSCSCRFTPSRPSPPLKLISEAPPSAFMFKSVAFGGCFSLWGVCRTKSVSEP
jgi:hypothetical protein